MSPQLKAVLTEAQELTAVEQVELINAISQCLQSSSRPLDISSDFWQPKSIDQLYDKQRVQEVDNIFDFSGDFWPDEESVDLFIEFIYKQRRDDRSNNQ